MATPHYSRYLQIKDKCCIAFFGPKEYLLQLLKVAPQIEQQLPGISLFIGCREEFAREIDSPRLIPRNACHKCDFGYFQELSHNMIENPVQKFLRENKLDQVDT